MTAKKKGGGGNLNRSQVVTVRLEPKMKFATELAARRQRRTVSSFIECAIEEAINGIQISNDLNMNFVINHAWDVEDADRFVKLAYYYPKLLTYDEEKLWKIIQEYEPFWRTTIDVKEKRPIMTLGHKSVYIDLIRHNWETLQKILVGDATPRDLSRALE